jgi:hypothetical protein
LCGSDTSLYIFKRQDQKWALIIGQEANDYEDISGALGRFRYAISPPSIDGQFYVVTKNVNPWCSSNWQGIRYQAMRQGISAYGPKILLKQEESIYLGSEIDGFITTSPKGFTIQFRAGQKLDNGVLTRDHIVSYQVRDDQVQRVPPFGDKPEDFLDEWFNLPWEEASNWVLRSARPSLNKVHAGVHADRSGERPLFYTSFVFDPPACRVSRSQWQVGVEFESLEGKRLPPGTPNQIYFTIDERGRNYFLRRTSKSSLPRCRF